MKAQSRGSNALPALIARSEPRASILFCHASHLINQMARSLRSAEVLRDRSRSVNLFVNVNCFKLDMGRLN